MRFSHFALVFIAFIPCSLMSTFVRADEPPREGERKYLLERVDDAAVVQLYADGFKDLPLKQKLLIWHLYQASLAGRDIYYAQRYSHSLAIRPMLEAIVAYPEGVDPKTLRAVHRYLKLFWINSGPYNHLTARKFVLDCTAQEFGEALQIAGETLPKPAFSLPTPRGLA